MIIIVKIIHNGYNRNNNMSNNYSPHRNNYSANDIDGFLTKITTSDGNKINDK